MEKELEWCVAKGKCTKDWTASAPSKTQWRAVRAFTTSLALYLTPKGAPQGSLSCKSKQQLPAARGGFLSSLGQRSREQLATATWLPLTSSDASRKHVCRGRQSARTRAQSCPPVVRTRGTPGRSLHWSTCLPLFCLRLWHSVELPGTDFQTKRRWRKQVLKKQNTHNFPSRHWSGII